jgi:hypothetical protein
MLLRSSYKITSAFASIQTQISSTFDRMSQLSWPYFTELTSRHDVFELLIVNWAFMLLGIFAALILYGIILVIYRLVFSPLARFPGPKIAAATGWYELYHDVVKPGQYFYKINEFHDKYG